MKESHLGAFLLQWLKRPQEMGSLVPSGGSLANAMARQVGEAGKNGTIIELGAGTGVITSVLLKAVSRADQLIVVENNPNLAGLLRGTFPDTRVVQRDAAKLSMIAREHDICENCDIVSGLPFLLLTRKKQYAILKQAFALIGSSGTFIQFTYGPKTPISPKVLDRLGITGKRVAFVWRNMPPAFVWRFEKRRVTPFEVHRKKAAARASAGKIAHADTAPCETPVHATPSP